jgi:hypothetical protein
MVRTVFRRYAEGGASQYRIARELNDAGMLREGRPWGPKQVGRILDNPAYAARCVLDSELVAASWEAIVDDDTWQRARAVRDSDKRRISLLRAARGGPYLLSGLLYCGHCGRKLVHRAISQRSGRRGGIYVCIVPGGGKWCAGGSIGSDRADGYVTERFLDRCHFRLEGAPTGYAEGRRAWERASIQQRRALLGLAIRRVVVVPWPGGEEPQRGTRRDLRIEWARSVLDRKETVVVAQAGGERSPRRRVSEGRPRDDARPRGGEAARGGSGAVGEVETVLLRMERGAPPPYPKAEWQQPGTHGGKLRQRIASGCPGHDNPGVATDKDELQEEPKLESSPASTPSIRRRAIST